MKTIIYTIALLICSISFISCSKDDEETDPDKNLANLYSLAIKVGIDPERICFRSTDPNPYKPLPFDPEEDLQLMIDNILMPGILNSSLIEEYGVQLGTMAIFSTASEQERAFGVAYFTLEEETRTWEEFCKKPSITIDYNDTRIELNFAGNAVNYTILD